MSCALTVFYLLLLSVPFTYIDINHETGATLREVLKHSTIEKVVMIEIDEMMVNASRQYLPEWNDCSNILGRSDNCFDDPHTELYCEDAFAWFKDRFSNQEDVRIEDKFDVVIMDAL